jgi:predicted SAM-dependent methyltransferase
VSASTETGLKLNIGSGRYLLDDWTNIDQWCDADVQADFMTLHYQDIERIRLSHVLEHFSWRETPDILRRLHGWLRPGGTLDLEVPDMTAIMERGTRHPLWFKYVYGDQSTPGEYHQAGFTTDMLISALAFAGFHGIRCGRFESQHPGRERMPVIYAEAVK